MTRAGPAAAQNRLPSTNPQSFNPFNPGSDNKHAPLSGRICLVVYTCRQDQLTAMNFWKQLPEILRQIRGMKSVVAVTVVIGFAFISITAGIVMSFRSGLSDYQSLLAVIIFGLAFPALIAIARLAYNAVSKEEDLESSERSDRDETPDS